MHRFAILVAATLAACASGPRVMGEAACLSADWAAYGYEDGVAGAPPSLGNDRAASCHRHGARMDRAAYEAGRTRGLKSFCAPPRGYRMGADGVPYRGQCAGHDEPAFTAEYERGYALYGYVSGADRAAHRLAALETERERVRTELARLASDVFAAAAPDAAARGARLVQAERRLTDRDIPAARSALIEAQHALDDHRAATTPPRDAAAEALAPLVGWIKRSGSTRSAPCVTFRSVRHGVAFDRFYADRACGWWIPPARGRG